MTTETLIKKLHKEVSVLQRDMREVKKTLLTMPQHDPEGEYQPAFVKKVFAREREKALYRFTTKEHFLKQFHGRKK